MAPSTSSFRPSAAVRLPILSRRPVRISITVSQAVHEALQTRSDTEGRSLSNLAAFLLEAALAQSDTAREEPDGRAVSRAIPSRQSRAPSRKP